MSVKSYMCPVRGGRASLQDHSGGTALQHTSHVHTKPVFVHVANFVIRMQDIMLPLN